MVDLIKDLKMAIDTERQLQPAAAELLAFEGDDEAVHTNCPI